MNAKQRQRRRTAKGPAKSGPRRIALLIGNARVRNSDGKGYALDLPGIDKDLASLRDVLGDREYGGFEIVSQMGPSLIEVRREIARVAEGLQPEDTLLIYYSGTSTLGRDQLLYLPVSDSDVSFLEATCLDSEYVLSVLRRCNSRRQVLLMDGCHSGAFFVNNRGIPDGFCAITSCSADQFSYGDASGGFFTRLLAEGLRGAAADSDGDGVVTTDELFRYVLPRAQAQSSPTTPQMWSWNLPEPIPLVHVRQRVFVSYRRADAAVADALLKRLEAAGYGVWLDRSDIGGGSRWRDAIEQALQQADAVIFLVSQPALESDEIYRELARAIEMEKTIVPLRLDPAPLFGWFKEKLGAIQHIEYDAHDPAEKWWVRLLAALRRARRVPSSQKAPDKAKDEPTEPLPPETRRKRRPSKLKP
jgi:hypothetical protein